MKIHPLLAGNAVSFLALAAAIATRPPSISPTVREFLSHVEMVDLPTDDHGGTTRAVRISGINVQIVNGSGSTDHVDGTGNLIVGYNELRGDGTDERLGSHNVVCGRRLNYGSYTDGAIVAGDRNTVDARYTVALGMHNDATGTGCTVLGGTDNLANGISTSVLGGIDNQAGGHSCTVSGGSGNAATSLAASVSGGAGRTAYSGYDWAAGSLFEDQ